ncbi:cytochrome P450 [Xylariomycetidae sp. FL2044]|nr:cytochrome P450 [Xylariomycetidae sp. FL2044]
MSLVIILTTVGSVSWLVWALWRKTSPATTLPGIPLVEFEGDNTKERYVSDAGTLLSRGYDMHIKHGRPFCFRDFLNPDYPRVFLPLKYMPELKNAPQEKLSLAAVLNNTSTMSKVDGPRITPEIQESARVGLNHALNKLIEPMQVLCFRSAEKQLPSCPEWTSIVPYPKIFELFSRMSARVMVGPELCEAWPAISAKYIQRVLAAQRAIRSKYYPVFYWTALYLNPEVALVNETRREAADLVRPVLEARQADHAAHGDDRAEKHDDFIQWIMENYRARGKTASPDDVVQNIFIVMFASLHGTSFIALQSLFSLLGTPDALAEIRGEIEEVSKKELKGQPVWTRHALGELRRLDSLMKETLRLKPFQEATVQRFSLTSYTFKDGLRIPAGTVVSFPNLRYNTDPSSASTPDAGTFDHQRWLRRRAGFDTSKFQFASTAEDAFDWGGGLNACPGRFMADVTIKLILISLVTRYDMRLGDDGSGGEGGGRPAESRRFMELTPDTSTPILVRDVGSC